MKKIKLILSVFFGTLFAFLIISCGEKPHVHNLIEHERKEAHVKMMAMKHMLSVLIVIIQPIK